MTQIDLTLRGVRAERVAAILALVAADLTVNPSHVSANAEFPPPTGLALPSLPDDIPARTLGEIADDVKCYIAPQYQPPSGPAHYEPAQVGTPTVGYGSPEPDEYAPFDPNVAAAVFGAKVEQAGANPQGAYAPPATVATAPLSTPVAPAAYAGGGTPGSASNWPASVDLSLGFDSLGRPWDKRINSDGNDKKLAKTQEWKLKRGIDKILVAKVQAQLDLLRGAVAPNPAAQAAPVGVLRVNDVVQPQGAQNVGQNFATAVAGYNPGGTPNVQDYGTHQVTTYAPPAPQGMTYGDIVLKCTSAIHSRAIAPLVVSGLLAHFKVADIADLEKHPDKWEAIASEITRLSGAQ